MSAFDRLVEKLRADGRQVRPTRDGHVKAQCPGHDDRSPSLSVTRIEGQALVHCFAGCQVEDVLAALKLTMADLYDERTGATYRYDDGRVVHRTPDRRFRQSGRTKGTGQLYRLAQVLAAVSDGRMVYLAEGEKDVHALEELGAVATTAPMGAGNWHKVDPSPLYGGNVVAVVDNDEAGQKWASAVRDSLNGKVKSLAFVKAKTGKDAADHVAAGHTLDELEPLEISLAVTARRLILTAASSIRPERQRWLWADRVPLGGLCLYAGREGLGKSTLANDLAARTTRGEVDGEFLDQPRDVLIVATEDNRATTIVPRLIAANADMDRVHFVTADDDGLSGQPIFPLDTSLLGDAIEQTKAGLVILDAATSVIDGKLDGDRDRQMRQALEPLGRLASDHNCAVVGIVHFGKRADSDTGKLILGSIAWSQVARSVIAVARDEDSGDLLIQPTKHNLAPGDTPALLARLVPHYVDTDDGPTSVGRVEWLGETDTRAVDLLGRRDDGPEERSERDEAVEWLRDCFSSNGGQVAAADAIRAAAKHGIAKTTLTRARQRIGARSVKSGMDSGWVWQADAEESTKNPKGSRAHAPDSSVPSVDSSQADCGHPAILRALNGKCALCVADRANAEARLSSDCGHPSIEKLPDGLCLSCAQGDPDAA